MKKYCLIITLFIGFNCLAQLFTFRNVNHKNGLVLSSVSAIAQDKYNYVWIGTDGAGLQRYDGKTLETIKVKDEENEHHITSIDPDNKGIYFSSRYFGFYCYRGNKYEKFLADDLEFGEHLLIKKTSNRLYLVGTKKLLIIRNNKVVKTFYFKENISSIKQIIEIPGGIFLISDKDSYLIENEKIVSLNNWSFNGKIYHFDCARYLNKKLELFDFKNEILFILNPNKIYDVSQIESKQFKCPIKNTVTKSTSKNNQLLIIDSLNNVYHFIGNNFSYIPNNSSKKAPLYQVAFIDQNQDYWLGTENNGFFKLSLDPFTKINLDPIYQDPLICFIYRNNENKVIISTFNNQTYLGSFKTGFKEAIDLRIYSSTKFQGTEFFATNKGIYFLSKDKLIPFNKIDETGKVLFIYSSGSKFYYSPEGQGLKCFENGKNSILIPQFVASHIYTAQTNTDQTKIFFGSNDGIYEYNLQTNSVNGLKSIFKYGDYVGVSTRDCYGTCWFTYGKILVGISSEEKYFIIKDKKYFNSTIFYTLDSDNYGNLLIGSNVGITRLKLSRVGKVKSSFHYNYKNGFEGFETHMRSHFHYDEFIFIGTIEGLYSINTKILETPPKPPKPLIFQSKDLIQTVSNLDDPIVKVTYSVINPKRKGVYYTYRLKGKSEKWSQLTTQNEAFFSNLTDEGYVFEVKSSYDGITFSDISSININKILPFWKSKWFILMLILSIALANIIVLDRSKSFQLSQIIENHSVEISTRIRSVILAFGLVSNTASHFLAGELEKSLPDLNWLNFITCFILLSLFILSVSKHRFTHLNKYLLHIGLVAILFQSYLGAYLSNIHPIFVIIISLCTAITPFILNRVYEIILFSVLQIVSASAIVFLVQSPQYNEILFLIAIIVSVCLSLFTTYIRNESLQKLMFTSGIINEGNVLAIAFDRSNHITFMSENSFRTLNIKPLDYLGKHISELNPFIHSDFSKRKIDLTNEFQDDQKRVLPMIDPNGKEIWMEWSCSVFSKSIKVIFGQDVSDRINIESNYESLVENADDLIYYVDVQGNFMFTNNKFRDKLGYDSEELNMQSSGNFIPAHYKQKVAEFYQNQFKNRTINTYFEFPVLHKDGSEIWVGQNTTLLYAAGSNKIVKGFLALARNITEKRAQEQLIEKQHNNITASITYAKKIQENLLPPDEHFYQLFKDFACFYQPKDIVSGDFYWLHEIDNKIIFVLSDCTGHGVPGAFMTLLGINLLNQIVTESNLLDPGEILSELDQKLIEILPSSNESLNILDGMELSLVMLDKSKKTLSYACAGGKFLSLQNDGEIIIHRGESKHIGDLPETNFVCYHTYNLNLNEIHRLFFFSDGITDQFGFGTHKKFSLKRLLELLSKNTDKNLQEQVAYIKEKVTTWQGDSKQLDDISFIGIEL